MVPVLGVVMNMAGMAGPDGRTLHPFGAPPADPGLGADTLAELPLDPLVVAASDAGTPLGEGPVADGLDRAAARIAATLKL
jgi:hypothetical protein